MLVLAVIIAAAYFPVLRRRMRQPAQVAQQSEEQARRELTQQTAAGAEPMGKAKLFWSSGAEDGSLMPVTVDLPLANDPVLRAKQVLNTLLAGPVDTDLRTLPPDAVLLAFYLLPDGTAISDFSEALATATPSGIESEQMAVDSITKTLEANVPQVHWLKILIHGQEVDTLAGHLDLTRTFLVNSRSTPAVTAATPKPATGAASGTDGKAAATAKPAAAASKLTPATPPGKLAQPAKKP
jgi:Sporulation and spore germination